MRQLDRVALIAWRCRVVNRAFGTSLPPDQVAGLLPDEEIELLALLGDDDQILDAQTYLKLLLKRP